MTLTDIERLAALDDAERTFQMDEETFRLFYERTARPVWLYLARLTGDDRLAEDLLQEAYFRFLRARVTFESDEHRRNYLFRIATNLARDSRSRATPDASAEPLDEGLPLTVDTAAAEQTVRRIDLHRAMGQLTSRERSLLWLAYAEGLSHAEIAAALGLRTGSLKALLYRARQHVMRLMGSRGALR